MVSFMSLIKQSIQTSKVKSSSLVSDEEEEKELEKNSENQTQNLEDNSHDEYRILLISVAKRYNKKKFKELFSDIEKNKDKYNQFDLLNNLIFTHFQFRCLLKIIERKFRKYYRLQTIKGLDKCLFLMENLLEEFTEKIESLPREQQKDQYEYLNYFHLKNLYFNSLSEFHDNNIPECLGYLSLAEKVIQKTSQNITHPKIWRITQRIYIFITSILISRNDYRSAKHYLKNILKLCYRDLDFSIFINYKDGHISKKILFNMLISFYQLGCIFEHQNNYEKAFSSFHQSNYISWTFLNEKYPDISFYINNVFTRAKNHFLFYKILSGMDIDLSKYTEEEKKIYKDQYNISEESRIKRFQKIEDYINKIHLVEIDDDHANLLTEPGKREKSHVISTMTKNVNLLNYLTSEDFKSTISKLKKMNINKLDIDIKRIIQKKIIAIKVEKDNKLKNSTKKFKKKKILLNTDLKDKNKNSHSNMSTYFISNNSSFRKSHVKNNSLVIPNLTSTHSRNPFKYPYDKYVFSKNYMKKAIFLENQINREYKFQKELLTSKKNEKIYIEPFDLEKVKSETELYYSMELERNLKILEEKNKSIKAEEAKKSRNKIYERMKYHLKDKICKSLDSKNNEKYKKFLKKFGKRESQVQREKIMKLLSFDNGKTNNEDFENPNYKNELMISNIINQIHNLEKKEILFKNQKRSKSKKKILNRNLSC